MSFIKSVKNKFKFLCIRIVTPAVLNCIFVFLRRKENTLLIIKPDGIGDYILFRNYLQFLKTSGKFNGHQIFLLTNMANKDLAINMDSLYVDGFFWYSDSYFLKWKLVKLLADLQALKVNTIIYPTYSRKYPVDWLVHQINAKNKIGIDGDTLNQTLSFKIKSDKYYSKMITVGNDHLHEFDRNKQIFETFTGQKCEFTKPFINGLNIAQNESIVIFPGGSESGKRWSAENFHQLCNKIITKLKTNIILTGGKDEVAIGEEISNGFSTAHLSNKTGTLSLVELSAVIGGSKLLISNDSVAVHLAVALNIPVICLSKGDLYGRFIPYPKHIYNKLENITPGSFNPAADKYTQWSLSDINEIPVDDVFNAARSALNCTYN
jgi:ADP-heptose:LPS heptosyltransferase